MDTKVIVVAGFIACTLSNMSAAESAQRKYSTAQYFKNYALSTCIADGYKSEEITKDAAAAARAYLEFGSLPLEAHTEATLLGREFLKREYKSVSGESLTLMKCVDFYNSKELGKIAAKYSRKKVGN